MYFNLTEDRTSLMLFRKQWQYELQIPETKFHMRRRLGRTISTLDVVKNGKGGATAKDQSTCGPLLHDHFKLTLGMV